MFGFFGILNDTTVPLPLLALIIKEEEQQQCQWVSEYHFSSQFQWITVHAKGKLEDLLG